MARRSMADISSGALTGAGSGAMIGGKIGGSKGAIIGGTLGLLGGGIGGYFSGKADQPYDAAELKSMGIQNQLGMAQLDMMEEEKKERKRREKMKKMFSSKVGRAFNAATRTMGAI